MLIREGSDRTDSLDRRLAVCLAAIAGAINASAFYSVGFFSANMTGNISTWSGRVALGEWAPALFLFSVALAFIAGAASSTLLIGWGRRRGIARIYGYVVLLEALLLSGAACLDLWAQDPLRTTGLILGLAFSMGLQNALVTRISGARIRTTHVSGIVTDIGIEIATAIDIARGDRTAGPATDNALKLGLHAYTLCAFASGGIAGVFVYRVVGGGLLFAAAALLVLIARWGTSWAPATTVPPAPR